jgi:hypothetical protein
MTPDAVSPDRMDKRDGRGQKRRTGRYAGIYNLE